ncbi:MAG: hypothetical protein MZV70_13520 [Desulfobacterales bacterium]|nr:hypothetical protein [Desulfobacterales bacterium]
MKKAAPAAKKVVVSMGSVAAPGGYYILGAGFRESSPTRERSPALIGVTAEVLNLGGLHGQDRGEDRGRQERQGTRTWSPCSGGSATRSG